MYSNEEYLLTLLQEAGLIGDKEIATAKGLKKATESLVETMIKTGAVSDEQVSQTLAVNSGMEFVDLHGYVASPEMKASVPEEVARRYKVAPLGVSQTGALQIAVSDPYDFETLDALPHVLQPDIEFFCATPALIRVLQSNLYGNEADITAATGGADGGDAPVIRLCQNILIEAIKARASDIHIEPLEKDVRVRYRIDGVLHDVEHHPKRLLSSMIARYKILTGSMNIDEKRVPQDGRIQTKYQDKELDLRVSMIPTNHGESVVMRILDKSGLRLGLADLGFLSDDQENFEKQLSLPDGIILVTGPTGSGKTTTLYACLNKINTPDVNILTAEDPIEYDITGLSQMQVNPRIGLTFASCLRAFLRQDPDVVMVGEIRDKETAEIAVHASLTGHLVLSTLHTNDAATAVTRLGEMGIETFHLTSSLKAILAQRLVRVLCPLCKEAYTPREVDLARIGIDAERLSAKLARPESRYGRSAFGGSPAAKVAARIAAGAPVTLYRAKGCAACQNTGFQGRTGIYELLLITDAVRALVLKDADAPTIRRAAINEGMDSLRDDGVRKVFEGHTTIEEVLAAAQDDV